MTKTVEAVKTVDSKAVKTNIIQNLEYIKASILNDTFKNQRDILKLIINETVEAIKDYKFTFTVNYSTNTFKNHYQVYINHAMKKKASLLADMEEVQRELFTRYGNPKRALKLILNMLNTGLYKTEVIAKINKWVNTTSSPTKTEIIYTK